MKKAFIIGLGRSGVSTAVFLKKSGWSIQAWDDNISSVPPEIKDVEFTSSPHWDDHPIVVMSPGISSVGPKAHPLAITARQKGCTITCDVGLFMMLFPEVKILAVTGTNGKSTTCALISHILDQCGIPHTLAGNIGIPIFSTLQEKRPLPLYVLEISSYQLELCADQPWQAQAGAILNITPHHLERHHSLERYIDIKESIFHHAHKKVLGLGNMALEATRQKFIESNLWTVGPKESFASITYDNEGIFDGETFLAWSPKDLFLGKPYMQHNASVAYAMLKEFPQVLENWPNSIEGFSYLPHRQEIIADIRNVTFVNDSKATTPDACLQALLSFSNPIYWLAGGQLQEDDLSVLTTSLKNVKKAFLFGQARFRLFSFLKEKGVACALFESMLSALDAACDEAFNQSLDQKKIVLLSPACPSFDEFKDFVHRGKSFVNSIARIPHTEPCESA